MSYVLLLMRGGCMRIGVEWGKTKIKKNTQKTKKEEIPFESNILECNETSLSLSLYIYIYI